MKRNFGEIEGERKKKNDNKAESSSFRQRSFIFFFSTHVADIGTAIILSYLIKLSWN